MYVPFFHVVHIAHSKNTIIANEQDNGSSLPSPPPSSHSIKDPSAAAPSTGEEPKGGEDTSPSSSISSSQEQLETGNVSIEYLDKNIK